VVVVVVVVVVVLLIPLSLQWKRPSRTKWCASNLLPTRTAF
jgi:energy-converting hydrogenase Eha subunit A